MLNNWTAQTICFWMRAAADANAPYTRIVEKGADSEWTIGINNGSAANKLFVENLGSGTPANTSAADVADGTWHFVALTIDPAYNCALMIDNATPVTWNTGFSGAKTGALSISQKGGSSGAYTFTGELNELLIFNRVLTGGEISFLYNGGTGRYGNPGDTDANNPLHNGGIEVAYHMDEDAGSTSHDFSGNAGYDAAINGDANWTTPGATNSHATWAACFQFDGTAWCSVSDPVRNPIDGRLMFSCPQIGA